MAVLFVIYLFDFFNIQSKEESNLRFWCKTSNIQKKDKVLFLCFIVLIFLLSGLVLLPNVLVLI